MILTADRIPPHAVARPGPRSSRLLVAALIAAYAAAGLAVLIGLDGRLTRSSDPGAVATHVGWTWLAAALMVGICLLTNRRVRVARATPGPRLGLDIAVLLGCSMAFPLLMLAPIPWAPEDHVLLKAALLLAVPGLVLWATHRRVGPGVRFSRPRLGALALVGVLAGIVLEQWLIQFGPGAAGSDFAGFDRTTIIVGATATALTASIGEEVFYRYWLQTRLEATLGRWAGILLASLIFGLMHLASHGAGYGLGMGAAVVIAHQGVSGLLYGWLWSRYRRLWIPIVLHLSSNGLLVLTYLLGLT